MFELSNGFDGNQKWIAGIVPLKNDIYLEIDTRTGKGVDKVLDCVNDFVKYQASNTYIPNSSIEDVEQDLRMIVITAIPSYDVSKGANLLTFLQNHVKNRIVNMYKFATEQRRTATHDNYRFFKVKCDSCLQTFFIDSQKDILKSCRVCGDVKQSGYKWKKHPILVTTLSANSEIESADGQSIQVQDSFSYDDISMFLSTPSMMDEHDIHSKMSIESCINKYDDTTRNVAIMLFEGHTVKEISAEIGLSQAKTNANIAFLKNKFINIKND